MILEHVVVHIRPVEKAAFEASLKEAMGHMATIPGCVGFEARPSVERPSAYHLFIRWRTIEDQLAARRQSSRREEWREILRPHCECPEEVEHLGAPVVSGPHAVTRAA